MSEWAYVGAAYGLTWVVLAVYTVYIRQRVRRSERELAAADGSSDDRVIDRQQEEN